MKLSGINDESHCKKPHKHQADRYKRKTAGRRKAGAQDGKLSGKTQASLNAAKKSSNRTQRMWRLKLGMLFLHSSFRVPGVPGQKDGHIPYHHRHSKLNASSGWTYFAGVLLVFSPFLVYLYVKWQYQLMLIST